MKRKTKSKSRVPVTVITGYLGSGKTTLLRQILKQTDKKLAIIMNEFGELNIDAKTIKGKAVNMLELQGGCVCCSLTGEFEEAIKEILQKVKPEAIVLETTGVAEPDAIIVSINEIPEVRLDGIITIVDCDSLVKFPQVGYTGRMQIEMADILLLNKIDLVNSKQLKEVENKIKLLNKKALIIKTKKCEVNTKLLFSLDVENVEKVVTNGKEHEHKHKDHLEGIDSFFYISTKTLNRKKFEKFLQKLPKEVYRAKGFVKFKDSTYLFNYVTGKYDFEKFKSDKTQLVFIGKGIKNYEEKIISWIKKCENG